MLSTAHPQPTAAGSDHNLNRIRIVSPALKFPFCNKSILWFRYILSSPFPVLLNADVNAVEIEQSYPMSNSFQVFPVSFDPSIIT